jgi:hypothetical protein
LTWHDESFSDEYQDRVYPAIEMRLLKTEDNGDFSVKHFWDDNLPPYAILSHTWGAEEVTLQELQSGIGKQKAGYRVIQFCAKQAASEDLQYFWVDNCCIDATNSSELSEAMSSMFR